MSMITFEAAVRGEVKCRWFMAGYINGKLRELDTGSRKCAQLDKLK